MEVFIDSKDYNRLSHSLEDLEQGQLMGKSAMKTIQKSASL